MAYLAVTFAVPWPGRHDPRFVFAPKRLGAPGYWCQVLITRWYAFHLLLKPCRTLRCRRCRLNSSACARSPYRVTGRAARGTGPGWAGSLSCSYARLSAPRQIFVFVTATTTTSSTRWSRLNLDVVLSRSSTRPTAQLCAHRRPSSKADEVWPPARRFLRLPSLHGHPASPPAKYTRNVFATADSPPRPDGSSHNAWH